MRNRERKNKEELTTGFRRPLKNWIDTQCKKTDAFLKKNNSKKAYQLVKDLTSETQGRSKGSPGQVCEMFCRRIRDCQQIDRILLRDIKL